MCFFIYSISFCSCCDVNLKSHQNFKIMQQVTKLGGSEMGWSVALVHGSATEKTCPVFSLFIRILLGLSKSLFITLVTCSKLGRISKKWVWNIAYTILTEIPADCYIARGLWVCTQWTLLCYSEILLKKFEYSN